MAYVRLPSCEISITPHHTLRPGSVDPSVSHPRCPSVVSQGEERPSAIRYEVGSNFRVLMHRIWRDRQRPEFGELQLGVWLEDLEEQYIGAGYARRDALDGINIVPAL